MKIYKFELTSFDTMEIEISEYEAIEKNCTYRLYKSESNYPASILKEGDIGSCIGILNNPVYLFEKDEKEAIRIMLEAQKESLKKKEWLYEQTSKIFAENIRKLEEKLNEQGDNVR